jgi:segregation and condensation protein B
MSTKAKESRDLLNEEQVPDSDDVAAADEELDAAEGLALSDVAGEEDTAPHRVQNVAERMAIIEALIFVAEEPLSTKAIAEVLKEDRQVIDESLTELSREFNGRSSGLQLREVGGGWQFATRPEYHEHVRSFLKSRPSAKLSLASLETLAVIAYKQPVTVPEILEIRGVQSPSSIKTLLDKKLIVAKGRKETVGRPMMYGTSKEFLIQFGLKDLSELPSIEDFEDLAAGVV